MDKPYTFVEKEAPDVKKFSTPKGKDKGFGSDDE